MLLCSSPWLLKFRLCRRWSVSNTSCISKYFLLLWKARLQLVKQSWPFHQAENWCKAHHGHLVSIHNDTENQQVYQLCHLGNTSTIFIQWGYILHKESMLINEDLQEWLSQSVYICLPSKSHTLCCHYLYLYCQEKIWSAIQFKSEEYFRLIS